MSESLLKSILSLRNTEVIPPTLEAMQITPALLEQIYLWASQTAQGGELASYIPELTCVDSQKKALAIADMYGNTLQTGTGIDTVVTFQSVIKPFLYIYALQQGILPEAISSIEPTAQHFNADPILQPDSHKNRPGHPLNNAGAISSAGAIAHFDHFLDFMRLLTGNERLDYIPEIYHSEMATNGNNRAIGYRLVATSRFNNLHEGELAVSNYTKACAIGVTPKEVVNAALVLASGGKINNKQVIDRNHVVRAINVMNSYGLYENTGQLSLMAAGTRALSCKSGVSGLIMNVDPGRGAFCTRSEERRVGKECRL